MSTPRAIAEADIGVIDFTLDIFRLRNGQCYAPGPGWRQVTRNGRPYHKILLRETGSDVLKNMDFWVHLREDAAFKRDFDAAMQAGLAHVKEALSYALPAGKTERNSFIGDPSRVFAKEHAYPRPMRQPGVSADRIEEKSKQVKEWIEETIESAFRDNPEATELVWIIPAEGDLQVQGDGRFLVKAYMRFAVVTATSQSQAA